MKLPFIGRLLGALSKKKPKKGKKGPSKRPGAKKGPVKATSKLREPSAQELTRVVPAAAGGSRASEAKAADRSEFTPPASEPMAPEDLGPATFETTFDPAAFADLIPPQTPAETESVAVPAPEPVRQDPMAVAERAADHAVPARALLQAVSEKSAVFSAYPTQLNGAIGMRNFQTIALVASALVADLAFLRDESLTLAKRVAESAEAFGASRQPSDAQSFSEALEAMQEATAKKARALEAMEARLLKAHQAKDYATLSETAGGIARDGLILASLGNRGAIASSEGKGLTATSSAEKAAMLDGQLAQLHQAILDRHYGAAADLARIISHHAGVLADPATAKAGQILQTARQLQQALKGPESPALTVMATNLAKLSGIFNGPLMDKANQLEGQIAQLNGLLGAGDLAKAYPLAVAIARASAVLTDSTVQKASLLSGYIPRVDMSLKRRDFAGAASALQSALS